MAAVTTAVASVAAPTSLTVYTQIFAATPFNTSKLVLANNTDQNMTIALGAAGSEIDLVCVAKGTTLDLNLSLNQCLKNTRISAHAAGAVGSSGYLTVSVLP